MANNFQGSPYDHPQRDEEATKVSIELRIFEPVTRMNVTKSQKHVVIIKGFSVGWSSKTAGIIG